MFISKLLMKVINQSKDFSFYLMWFSSFIVKYYNWVHIWESSQILWPYFAKGNIFTKKIVYPAV